MSSRNEVIEIVSHGNFKKLDGYLERIKEVFDVGELNKLGEEGVEALKASTPRRTGKTANSWYYKIERKKDGLYLIWCNSNVIKDYANIALLINYGHGTKSGTWVEGYDYIEPALKPIFDKIANTAMEVIKH